MKVQIQPRWLKVKTAVEYCGLSEKSLKHAIAKELIKTHLVNVTGGKGGSRLIDRESLDAWIEGKPAS